MIYPQMMVQYVTLVSVTTQKSCCPLRVVMIPSAAMYKLLTAVADAGVLTWSFRLRVSPLVLNLIDPALPVPT